MLVPGVPAVMVPAGRGMKILWHSAAPWEPTGYGVQTGIWCRWLRDQGHEVVISARSGLMYRAADWDGVPVLPGPPFVGDAVQDDVLPMHIQSAYRPDVVVILYDLWNFSIPPARFDQVMPAEIPVIFWHPVDCDPLDARERDWLALGRLLPLAMSEFGKRVISAGGFGCEYIPHAVDLSVYSPLVDEAKRAEVRAAFQIEPGQFAIGINATSTDAVRKGLFEQMAAFAQFRRRHKSAVLMIHSLPRFPGGMDILAAAADLGIPTDVLRFAPPYQYLTGQIPAETMAAWYGACDVLSNCTYGEGFGLAAIEAQACGTPVILSRGSTGEQLVGPGWLVDTQPWWNGTHVAKWHAPQIRSITRAYEQAYLDAKNRRRAAWKFATGYSVPTVGPMWEPVLKEAVEE
jgi:glycosyltransferase involved in cell wall biosynthesis